MEIREKTSEGTLETEIRRTKEQLLFLQELLRVLEGNCENVHSTEDIKMKENGPPHKFNTFYNSDERIQGSECQNILEGGEHKHSQINKNTHLQSLVLNAEMETENKCYLMHEEQICVPGDTKLQHELRDNFIFEERLETKLKFNKPSSGNSDEFMHHLKTAESRDEERLQQLSERGEVPYQSQGEGMKNFAFKETNQEVDNAYSCSLEERLKKEIKFRECTEEKLRNERQRIILTKEKLKNEVKYNNSLENRIENEIKERLIVLAKIKECIKERDKLKKKLRQEGKLRKQTESELKKEIQYCKTVEENLQKQNSEDIEKGEKTNMT